MWFFIYSQSCSSKVFWESFQTNFQRSDSGLPRLEKRRLNAFQKSFLISVSITKTKASSRLSGVVQNMAVSGCLLVTIVGSSTTKCLQTAYIWVCIIALVAVQSRNDWMKRFWPHPKLDVAVGRAQFSCQKNFFNRIISKIGQDSSHLIH